MGGVSDLVVAAPLRHEILGIQAEGFRPTEGHADRSEHVSLG